MGWQQITRNRRTKNYKMDTIKFKTNIKCGGCIDTVSPHLNALTAVQEWTVDTNVPEKILTVKGDTRTITPQVIAALEKAGYTAELL
jgi:copper chaperone